MKNVFFYDYPAGTIGIAEEDCKICRVFFCGEKELHGFETAKTPLIEEASGQLWEYFCGKRKQFDLPLKLSGTDFQMKVWRALQAVPFSETCSYKEIAEAVGNPRASRAVGMANNRNPLHIIIPCHRVTGRDGSLTGYAGGLAAKEFLLNLEKSAKKNS